MVRESNCYSYCFLGEITCESPNNRLDRYEGRLVYKGQTYPLDNNKLLLRGCRLRNTRWCYGLVVFAGKDTKLMMNSGKTKFKRTSLDRFLNILIMGVSEHTTNYYFFYLVVQLVFLDCVIFNCHVPYLYSTLWSLGMGYWPSFYSIPRMGIFCERPRREGI